MTDKDPEMEAEDKGGDSGDKKQIPTADINDEVSQNLENIFCDPCDDDVEDGIPEEASATPVDEKPAFLRADGVGRLDDEEEAVVDWVDEEPEPDRSPAEEEPESSPVEDMPEPEEPPAPAATPASPPATAAAGNKPGAAPAVKKPRAGKKPGTPQKPSPKPAPPVEPVSKDKPSPGESPEPEVFEARQPLTGRIIVWGAVLIIITYTAQFLATYEPEEIAPATAESGLLFHKITPAPPPPAGSPATVKPEPAQPAVNKPQEPKKQKVVAPPAKAGKKAKTYIPRSYPYSIHMASFSSPETARENVANYRRGFQAYLVRIDLGKKGIWYRLYLGHFPNATSAMDAIQKYKLKKAIVSRNLFACLVGSYTSAAQAETVARRLDAKGFDPYTIIIEDTHHLFVGAHLNGAEGRVLSKNLAARGFANNLVER